MSVKSKLRKLVPPETLGAWRYRYNPSIGRAWGGPLNGQRGRCLLMAALVNELEPYAFVETGTYLGTTTEWLSSFQLPVFTIEANTENFGFSRARLAGCANVHLTLGDSRRGLRALLDGPLSEHRDKNIIVYLDAHWNKDLPLIEELDIVFEGWPRAVVLIDDFQVPDDPSYMFDDYGGGMALTPAFVERAIDRHGLLAFYPSLPASAETGARRGCVVLAREAHAAKLATIPNLRAPAIKG
jgi:hypothetical protein